MGIFLAGFAVAGASLQISVATDKPVYQINETVGISITVSNSGSTSETLYGGFYFTTYIMDGIYNWAVGRSGPDVVLSITILPGQSKTWDMSHGLYELQEYPLVVGSHSVVGGAGYTLLSSPVEFQVVPEPVTISLLAFGFLLLRRKK
jgi:hypothetical protein